MSHVAEPMTVPSDRFPRVARTSADQISETVGRLARAVPDCVRDGRVDLERLRELVGELSEDGQERYGLSWAGRRSAVRLLQTPTTGTLLPMREHSLRFDSAEHVLIEGENLEVLKLLHRSYHDRVSLIYIDPPYNRIGGRELVYLDNYQTPLEGYLRLTGQLDETGNVTTSDVETQGRRHSVWLSMMYPRLKVAQQLLAKDGLIFVSIDDNEDAALRFLMDEIFGETNRIAELIWSLGSGPTAGHFMRSHETVLCYARDKDEVPNFEWRGGGVIRASALKKISRVNPPSEITFPAGIDFEGSNAVFRGTLGGAITQTVVSSEMRFANGKLAAPVTLLAGWAMKAQIEKWVRGEETVDSQGQRLRRLYFNSSGLLHYEKERSVERPRTVIEDAGSTADGSKDIAALGLEPAIFDFPKPVTLIEKFVRLATDPAAGDIVLDFFAGSGTTAHAVARLNAADSGNRRSISVQLPQPTPADSPARRAGYPTLADVARARITAALRQLEEEGAPPSGLRVVRLAPSNFHQWREPVERTPEALRTQLSLAVDPVAPSATPEAIAFEVAVKEGFGVSISMERMGSDADSLWRVADSTAERHFFLSLADRVDPERVAALGITKDDLLVCRDAALDDTTAANLALTFTVKTL